MNKNCEKQRIILGMKNKLKIASWLVYDIILLKLVEKSGLYIMQELKSWLEVALLKISSRWVIVKQQQKKWRKKGGEREKANRQNVNDWGVKKTNNKKFILLTKIDKYDDIKI